MTCVLCGQSADFLLVFQLDEKRVEVLLCGTHLEIIQEDHDEVSVKFSVEPVTRSSVNPGPNTTRISPPLGSK